MKCKDEINFIKSGSIDRPAWTSVDETGQLEAYKHKHTIYRGKFTLLKNYYQEVK